MKTILVIIRSAPYGQSKSKDAIDFILTAAAYDQDLHVLFQNDGVYQLIDHQAPEQLGFKNINKLLSAFEMYEIEKLYVDTASLEERDLTTSSLCLDAISSLDQRAKIQLIAQADTVLTF